jgi:uncharacterized delta-60 repeat protein
MKGFFLLAFLLPFTLMNVDAQPGKLLSSRQFSAFAGNFNFTDFDKTGQMVVGLFTINPSLIIGRSTSNLSLGGQFSISIPQYGPVFDSAGHIVATSEYCTVASAAIGSDGGIVILYSAPRVLGQTRFALQRITSSGRPDSSFNNGSSVLFKEYGALNDFGTVYRIVLLDNGEMIVTGVTSGFIDLMRFNNKGFLLSTRQIDLKDFEYYVNPYQLFIQPEGKIVIASVLTRKDGTNTSAGIFIARFNSDGSRDAGFGKNGLLMSTAATALVSITPGNNGNLLVVADGNRVMRFTNNGSLDPGLGNNGALVPGFSARKAVAQADGKIIVGGTFNADYAIARYDSAGKIDTGFGTGGLVTTGFTSRFQPTNDAIQNMVAVDDRLYVNGTGNEALYDLGNVETPVTEPPVTQPPVDSSAIVNTNTKSGSGALQNNTSGAANSAYGYNALQANTTGTGNTGIGYNALFANATGLNNTATGGAAMASNTTGSNNVAYGVGAGFSQNNNSSTFIGTFADATTVVTNSTALGYRATVNASNQVRIGNSAVTSIGGFTNWTNLSDSRFKMNINEDVPGLAFITQLRPVTYTLDLDGIDTKLRTNMATRHGSVTKALSILPPSPAELQAKVAKSKVKYTGFVAQEVEEAAKKLGYDFSGVDVPKEKEGYYGLRYAEFVVPLVKAVQEQQKQIVELKEQLSKLVNGQNAPANNTVMTLSSAYLEQNYPNPNNGNTIVRYHLPEGAGNAQVVFTNMKGQVMRSVTLNNWGDGQITINASTLAAGTYNYSLWVSRKEVDTKRMVVGR